MDYETKLEQVDEVAKEVLDNEEYESFTAVRDRLATGEAAPEDVAGTMNRLELELVRAMDDARGRADSAYTARDDAEQEETVTADGQKYRSGGDLRQQNREADEHAKDAVDSFDRFQRLRGDYQVLQSLDEDLDERMGDEYSTQRNEDGLQALREERAAGRGEEADAYDSRMEDNELSPKES